MLQRWHTGWASSGAHPVVCGASRLARSVGQPPLVAAKRLPDHLRPVSNGVVRRTVAVTSLLLLLTAGAPLRLQTAEAPPHRVVMMTDCPFVQVGGTDWRAFSDAVVRVRIDSKTSFETPGLENSSYTHITTGYEANVIEVLKTHPRSLGAGASQTLYYPGGSIQRADGSTDTLLVARSPNLAIGSEWLLFLSWHEGVEGFMVDNGVVGAFEIEGDRVQPAGDDRWAAYWRGRTTESFMDAMRQFVTQHRNEPRRVF